MASSTLCGPEPGPQHDTTNPDTVVLLTPQPCAVVNDTSLRAKSSWDRFRHLTARNAELKHRVHRASAALICAASGRDATVQPSRKAARAASGTRTASQELLQLPLPSEDGPRPPTTAPLFQQPERARSMRSFRCRARLSPPQVAQLSRVPGHSIAVAAKAYMARVAAARGCGESDVYWFVESDRAVAQLQHGMGGLAVGLTLASTACMRSWALIGCALQLEALLLQMEGMFPD